MSDLITLIIVGFGLLSVVAGIKHGSGKPIWLWPIIGTTVVVGSVAGWVIKNFARGTARTLVTAAPHLPAVGSLFRRRVADPETAEMISRKPIIPNRTLDIQQLGPKKHWTPAGVLDGVHKVKIAESGAGKGETGVKYEIQYHLQHSDESLLILEVKPNKELTHVVTAYARPEDLIWVYTMQPRDKHSSALAITDLEDLKNLANAICDEPGSKDPHWNHKSATLIPEVARGLAALDGTPGLATLPFVRDAIVDREMLGTLRKECRNVDNVADVAKEWGYIRSNASRHLDALADPRVRRVFAGDAKTPQPTFAGYEDGGRDIVIVRPNQESAAREDQYIVAILDILLKRTIRAGYSGGPGTRAILDEFASFVDLTKLKTYLDLGRGGRLSMSYVLQGRGQLAAVVGDSEADSILYSTEIKEIGATSDLELAQKIAEWSGRSRVDYRSARQSGELFGAWAQESTYNVRPDEVTRQKEGEWTIIRQGEIHKRKVAKEHYHHTQAAKPSRFKIRGVVKPEKYMPRVEEA